MPFDSESAKRAGRRSGASRRKLNPGDVAEQLGPLDSLDDAMRRLDMIGLWALGGLVPGVVAGAAVRSVEVWLRAKGEDLDLGRVKQMEGKIAELEGQLATRRIA